jgi:hypothetical protein
MEAHTGAFDADELHVVDEAGSHQRDIRPGAPDQPDGKNLSLDVARVTQYDAAPGRGRRCPGDGRQ